MSGASVKLLQESGLEHRVAGKCNVVNSDANLRNDEECTYFHVYWCRCCWPTVYVSAFVTNTQNTIQYLLCLFCFDFYVWNFMRFSFARTIKCRYLIRNSTWSDNLKATFNWYIATEIRELSECLSTVDVLQNAVWIAAMCHVREWVLNVLNNLYYAQEMNEVNSHYTISTFVGWAVGSMHRVMFPFFFLCIFYFLLYFLFSNSSFYVYCCLCCVWLLHYWCSLFFYLFLSPFSVHVQILLLNFLLASVVVL